jgi:pimeloyl-ACP methyl ester carboxylesterase
MEAVERRRAPWDEASVVLDAAFVVAMLAVAFVVGAAVYVVGSYMMAHRHVPRGMRAALGDMARELTWTVVVQPLLPLYWLFGRRMASVLRGDAAAHLRPVVFVHGYAQNRADFVRIARALRRRGFAHLFGFNYPWLSSIGANAARLRRFVDEVCEECGASQVDLVCHSMGGLVAMQYVHHENGGTRVARCVTIATPFRGVSWRGPILGGAAADLRRGFSFAAPLAAGARPVPDAPPPGAATRMLSIYSRNDNIVHPVATSSLTEAGGRDLDAGTMGHLAILFDPAVAEAVADFLIEPDPPAKTEVSVEAVDAAHEAAASSGS